MNLNQQFDNIKKQLLQNDFIHFIFIIYDMRKFITDYKKISLDFLTYKDQFPLRAEAQSYMNIIIKKFHNLNQRTENDLYIYDEMIKNAKLSNLISKEIYILQNYSNGSEIISVVSLFNIFLCNEDKELTHLMDNENVDKYLKIAIKYIINKIDTSKYRVIFIIGPPGVGKNTQCDLLVKKYNLIHLGAGDLLRGEIKKGSEDGKLIKGIIEKGEIVPVKITC